MSREKAAKKARAFMLLEAALINLNVARDLIADYLKETGEWSPWAEALLRAHEETHDVPPVVSST